MAEADASRVAELLSTVGTDNEAVAGLLERIAVTAGCNASSFSSPRRAAA